MAEYTDCTCLSHPIGVCFLQSRFYLQSFFLLKHLLFNVMCMDVMPGSISVHTCMPDVVEARGVIESPGTGVTDGYDPPCGC